MGGITKKDSSWPDRLSLYGLLRLPEVPPPLRLGPEDVGARGAVGEEHVVAGVPLVVAVVLGSNSIDNRLIGHLMIHNMQITLDIKFIS